MLGPKHWLSASRVIGSLCTSTSRLVDATFPSFNCVALRKRVPQRLLRSQFARSRYLIAAGCRFVKDSVTTATLVMIARGVRPCFPRKTNEEMHRHVFTQESMDEDTRLLNLPRWPGLRGPVSTANH